MSHDRAIPGSAADRAAAHRRIVAGCALILAPLLSGLAACGGDTRGLTGTYDATAQLAFGHGSGDAATGVDPDEPLTISASRSDGRITDVVAVDEAGRSIPGELAADGASWRSLAPLAADTRYSVRVSTENRDGAPGRGTHTFRTGASDAATLDIAFGPEPGTYGVGQPLTAELSRAVADPAERALVESGLRVSTEPEVTGSWHWVDDKLLHYRPREYWPANAEIRVSSELTGVHIRDGLRGGKAEPVALTTGDRIEAVADVAAHTLTVSRNGETLRTLPMTTGKEGFRTRSGKKVVLAKEANVRMTSTSIGIPAGDAESYDLDVQWATRLTWSGEYVHAAPWSAASHGVADVSHGCTGLSVDSARWFFDLVRPGDVVEYVNAYGEDMAPFGNGFGDWNLSWEEWRAGSALADAPGDDAKNGAHGTDGTGGGDAAGAADGADAEPAESAAGAPGGYRLRPQV